MISSFVTDVTLVTILPQIFKEKSVFLSTGNPKPVIVAYIPPFIPTSAGVTVETTKGIEIFVTELIST